MKKALLLHILATTIFLASSLKLQASECLNKVNIESATISKNQENIVLTLDWKRIGCDSKNVNELSQVNLNALLKNGQTHPLKNIDIQSLKENNEVLTQIVFPASELKKGSSLELDILSGSPKSIANFSWIVEIDLVDGEYTLDVLSNN